MLRARKAVPTSAIILWHSQWEYDRFYLLSRQRKFGKSLFTDLEEVQLLARTKISLYIMLRTYFTLVLIRLLCKTVVIAVHSFVLPFLHSIISLTPVVICKCGLSIRGNWTGFVKVSCVIRLQYCANVVSKFMFSWALWGCVLPWERWSQDSLLWSWIRLFGPN